jgi:two-component system sensor histidine kinase/response regulator
MKRQILVVDDDVTNRMLLEALLKSNGYDVVLAEDGQHAIDQCERDHPDLVLLDVFMPGMTGHEVAAYLKKHAGTEQTPIIMLTASDEQSEIQKAHQNGASDYVVKPFDAVDLLGKIKRVLT